MKPVFRRPMIACLVGCCIIVATASAGPPLVPREPPPLAAEFPKELAARMPITGLAPAKIVPNLCSYHYRISTNSEECQAFFDQGLAYWYSYVWMEAARSFETAALKDPACPMPWWGLSRALERWGRGRADDQLKKAHALLKNASHREQQLIIARMQERGLLPGVGDGDARKKAAIQTIDNMIALYDDDEEAWYYRAQLAGGASLFGGTSGSVPFYKALLRINPLHPGANHELVHYYENSQRPALGWSYSENYIKSSPGIPHPWHMQSHLATRLGRWDRSSDSSTKAIELQRAYHKEMQVKPHEDHQFQHHLEVLTMSLVHDGRFREVKALMEEVKGYGYRFTIPWFRMYMAEQDWAAALQLAEEQKRSDKTAGNYLAALVYLAQNDVCRAAAEVHALELALAPRKDDKTLQLRLWETRGLLLCQTGDAEQGLKLLQQAVEQTKDNYQHHAWGNGAYYMEVWGRAALRCGKFDVAEEGFLEALAHDSGSVRGALGMQVLCEQTGRSTEARRYDELARRFWKHAETKVFDALLKEMRDTVGIDQPRKNDSGLKP